MRTLRLPIALLWAALGFICGVLFAGSRMSGANEQTQTSKQEHAAYLVAGWNITAPEKMGPFVEAATPLAEKAGFQYLAGDNPQVLEGTWPFQGIVILQKYDSMDALLSFWNSPEHSEAKKLREGIVTSHFVIAVEAYD